MTLTSLECLVALAEHRHFGKAAQACKISQPGLSAQLNKLEEELGVRLFERNNRKVLITPVGDVILDYARRALREVGMAQSIAKANRNQLEGPFRLGVIPTLAPYLMPLVLGPLRKACPLVEFEFREDLTAELVERVRDQRLDAALIATEAPGDLTAVELFEEPFLAALPSQHKLKNHKRVEEKDLAADLLVLADGHCLAGQARAACSGEGLQKGLHAASLETLVNLVAAGYGTTLIPQLAADSLAKRGVELRPLAGRSHRTVRLASRPTFPRPKALKKIGQVIQESVTLA